MHLRRLIFIALLLGIVAFGGFALWLGYEAGELPFQTDPTRIPVVPFEDLPTAAPSSGGTPTVWTLI